jgi:hypothetical protein
MNASALLARLAVVVLALLAAACASTPKASPDRDALAKEFLTRPEAATIYVYRSPFNDLEFDSVLYIDGRLIGRTRPGAYYRVDTVPGRHVLHGTGVDMGEYAVNARPGQIYVVSVDVVGGNSRFELVPDYAAAQERVRACCALLENWGPSIRPFVR